MRHIPLLLFGYPLLTACAPTQQAVAPSPTYEVAPAPTFSAGQASLRLKAGMTEKEAIAAIGWQPDSAEVRTCGGETERPWQLRVLVFSPLGNQQREYLDDTVDCRPAA